MKISLAPKNIILFILAPLKKAISHQALYIPIEKHKLLRQTPKSAFFDTSFTSIAIPVECNNTTAARSNMAAQHTRNITQTHIHANTMYIYKICTVLCVNYYHSSEFVIFIYTLLYIPLVWQLVFHHVYLDNITQMQS